MKALVLTAYNHLEIQDWPRPEIAADEVLLRVAACGICGSDIHGMDGSTGRRQPPIIMGHEAAGTIVEGRGRTSAIGPPGDRVTFDSTIYCGRAGIAAAAKSIFATTAACWASPATTTAATGPLPSSWPFRSASSYRVPDERELPPRRDGRAAVDRLARRRTQPSIALGDTAVVVGAGMIGLLVVQVAAGQRLRADLSPSTSIAAGWTWRASWGPTKGLSSEAVDVPAEVFRRTGGRGADLAFEAVGIATTVQLAMACIRKGGQLTLVGNLAPASASRCRPS